MQVVVPRERMEGEHRVALTPPAVEKLVAAGMAVRVEAGAGTAAGYPDDEYGSVGATLAEGGDLYAGADVTVRVQRPSEDEVRQLPTGSALVALLGPLSDPDAIAQLATSGVEAYAMEMIPRISRAQSMDALSSMSTIAGYRAVLIAANELPRFFPMLMTAAGTVAPARVLVLGAGVAGLQAIATARRLGAVVSAFDTRAVVREQVQSLGATFLEIDVAADAEAAGGYARELTEEEQERQRELVATHIAQSDVVITTALVPGRPAPVLIPRASVEAMRPGSVIVDLASEAGGNCEVTQHGTTVRHGGVSVIGPANLPATMAYHASQLYARNVSNLLQLLAPEGSWAPDFEDEIVAGTCVCRNGEVVHPMVRERLAAHTGGRS